MAYVFISYSKKNRDYARRLANHLQTTGFDVWIDDRIDFGANWEREIFKAIDDCDAFIVIMTAESHESDWVQRERLYADDQKKPSFPLLLTGKVFPFFVGIQYYDMRGEKLPEHPFIERLAAFVPRKETNGHDIAAVPQRQAESRIEQPSGFQRELEDVNRPPMLPI